MAHRSGRREAPVRLEASIVELPFEARQEPTRLDLTGAARTGDRPLPLEEPSALYERDVPAADDARRLHGAWPHPHGTEVTLKPGPIRTRRAAPKGDPPTVPP